MISFGDTFLEFEKRRNPLQNCSISSSVTSESVSGGSENEEWSTEESLIEEVPAYFQYSPLSQQNGKEMRNSSGEQIPDIPMMAEIGDITATMSTIASMEVDSQDNDADGETSPSTNMMEPNTEHEFKLPLSPGFNVEPTIRKTVSGMTTAGSNSAKIGLHSISLLHDKEEDGSLPVNLSDTHLTQTVVISHSVDIKNPLIYCEVFAREGEQWLPRREFFENDTFKYIAKPGEHQGKAASSSSADTVICPLSISQPYRFSQSFMIRFSLLHFEEASEQFGTLAACFSPVIHLQLSLPPSFNSQQRLQQMELQRVYQQQQRHQQEQEREHPNQVVCEPQHRQDTKKRKTFSLVMPNYHEADRIDNQNTIICGWGDVSRVEIFYQEVGKGKERATIVLKRWNYLEFKTPICQKGVLKVFLQEKNGTVIIRRHSYSLHYLDKDYCEKIEKNCEDERVHKSLHHCAWNGNLKMIKQLIKNGVSLTSMDARKFSPLHLSVLNKKTEVSEYLIKKMTTEGYSLDIFDDFGLTPLHWTCSMGDSFISSKLKEGGADLNILDKLTGLSPLSIAFKNSNLTVQRILISGGAKLSTSNPPPYQSVIQPNMLPGSNPSFCVNNCGSLCLCGCSSDSSTSSSTSSTCSGTTSGSNLKNLIKARILNNIYKK